MSQLTNSIVATKGKKVSRIISPNPDGDDLGNSQYFKADENEFFPDIPVSRRELSTILSESALTHRTTTWYLLCSLEGSNFAAG